MPNFKIFISYRRSGGYDTAKLLYEKLKLDGYSVYSSVIRFFDLLKIIFHILQHSTRMIRIF